MSALASEWRIVSREPVLRWTILILILLTILALWNGMRFADSRTATAEAEITRSLDKRAVDRETLQREIADPARANPWVPGEPTRADWNATRPPGPLAALSFGREDLEPFSANVSLWMVRTGNLFRKYEFASPVAIAAGRFDAGFLVVLILPPFALALGYNVIAEERESGRLRLARLQHAGIGQHLFVRMLLRQAPAYMALAIITIWTIATLRASLRLGMWAAVSLAYLLFWTGATAIAAGTGRSRQEDYVAQVTSFLHHCRDELSPLVFCASTPGPHRHRRPASVHLHRARDAPWRGYLPAVHRCNRGDSACGRLRPVHIVDYRAPPGRASPAVNICGS